MHQRCNVVQDDLVEHVFNDMSNSQAVANTVILTPKNDSSLKINENVLKKIDGDEKVYFSSDSVICDDEAEEQNYAV